MSLIWLILKFHKDPIKECEMRPETKFRKLNMYYKNTSALWLSILKKLSYTKTNHVHPHRPINYMLHIVRVCMYVELKMWHFKYILEEDASDLVGREGGMRMWIYFGLYN